MARTDKDLPFDVRFPNWRPFDARNVDCSAQHAKLSAEGMSGDSGFRKARKWMKRRRTKAIRRYRPEAAQNGAKAPYNGLKRTWDFE